MPFLLEMEHYIFSLARSGNLKKIKELVRDDKSLVSLKTSEGSPVVLFAAEQGHLEVVKFLLENGADIQGKAEKENTILLQAAFNGHLPLVKWLVASKKVSIKQKDSQGYTALLLAVLNDHLPVIKWLVEEQKVKLTEKGPGGFTALLLAASNGHLDIVQWLVEKQKVSLLEKTDKGSTALWLAAGNGHFEVMQWLVEKQRPSMEEMEDALYYAIAAGNFEQIKWLIDVTKMDVNKTTANQEPLLFHWAINASAINVVKRLLINYKFSYQTMMYIQEKSLIHPPLRALIDEHFGWIDALPQPEDHMMCPITCKLMAVPVIAPDGHTYEKEAIVTWLNQRSVSPMTRQAMKPNELYRNIFAEGAINNFLSKANADLENKRGSSYSPASLRRFFPASVESNKLDELEEVEEPEGCAIDSKR